MGSAIRVILYFALLSSACAPAQESQASPDKLECELLDGFGNVDFTVLPAKNMVLVHQVDIDKNAGASVSPSSYIAMLSMLANANCGDNCK